MYNSVNSSVKEDSRMFNSERKRYRLRYNISSDKGIETLYIPFEKMIDIFLIVLKVALDSYSCKHRLSSGSVEVYRSELDKWVNIDEALWS